MRSIKREIESMVHELYWAQDLNCATTVVKVLSRIYDINIEDQVLESLVGMHGAGGFGAQCGLVEGSLMFLGIYGKSQGLKQDQIIKMCFDFAHSFEKEFLSLSCSELRPGGFRQEDPPHLCEGLTIRAIYSSYMFIDKNMN